MRNAKQRNDLNLYFFVICNQLQSSADMKPKQYVTAFDSLSDTSLFSLLFVLFPLAATSSVEAMVDGDDDDDYSFDTDFSWWGNPRVWRDARKKQRWKHPLTKVSCSPNFLPSSETQGR